MDVAALWDFADPAGSEARFRAALATARGDDALVIETQIARSFGLRRRFGEARALLDAIEPRLAAAGAEPRARHLLERGRTLRSAMHDDGGDAEAARRAFLAAADLARAAGLDALRIDAIHMLAFCDDGHEAQLAHARTALEIAVASDQPAANAWEASLRNNAGLALHGLGRLEEALDEFQLALWARETQGDEAAIRVAWWMIAWTLRCLGRTDEALAIQERLAAENAAAGAPDPYVFDELAELHAARGDVARASAAREQAAGARSAFPT